VQKESSTNKLNILNLAERDNGGAGVATSNINKLFIKAGHNSKLVVKQSRLMNNNVIAFKKIPSNYWSFKFLKVKNRFQRIFNKKKKDLFDAKYGLLVSTKEIPEEIKRLSKVVSPYLLSLPAYKTLTLVHFNGKDKQFVDWFPENPFENDTVL